MISIGGHKFEPYINAQQINERVRQMAADIQAQYHDKNPILLTILNGAIFFAIDLMRNFELDFKNEVTFVKVSSYKGFESTGIIEEIIGLDDHLKGRHIIVVEDIIDSGLTMHEIYRHLMFYNPASIAVATFLLKPKSVSRPIEIDYIGFEIDNSFVVGYGLDYDQQGRHLPEIYKIITT